MTYAVELLRKFGCTEIAVTLQYLPHRIIDHFGSGEDYGVRLYYFLEDAPLGTAGSVKNAASFLDTTFVVVSGDALTDFPLDEAVEFHRSRGALATLVLASMDNPLEYGVVITETDGRIRRFLEKPTWGEVFSDRVNTGIYVLEPEVLECIPAGQAFDFSKDLFPLLLREGAPVYGCTLKGFWCDIGSIFEYRRANQEMLAGRVSATLPGEERAGGIRVGKNTVIDPRASLRGPVIVGSNCRIEAGVTIDPYTVIGDGVIVEEGASLKQAVIWDGVLIGRRAAVRSAVVGQRVMLEDNTCVYEGAVVGDGSTVRTFSVVKPEVKIWPEKEIAPYSTVKENVVWGSSAPRSLCAASRTGGLLHRDLTPILAAQAAAAYASSLESGGTVALGWSAGRGPELLALAMASGLRAAGLGVACLGETIPPLTRYAVRAKKLAGGLHISRDPRRDDRFWLVFLDERGLPLAPGRRRKIESTYQLGEFRWVKEVDLPGVEDISEVEGAYRAYLLEALGPKRWGGRRLPLVVHTEAEKIWELLQGLSKNLPWDLIRVADAPRMREEILSRKAAGGLTIDAEGENLGLWDERGEPVPRPTTELLFAQVLVRGYRIGVVAVPVTATSRVQALAQEAGVTVRWVRHDWRAIAEAVWQEPMGGPQVQMLGDALYALASLGRYLTEQDLTLSQALASLPETYQKVKGIPCPQALKGRVMRELVEEQRSTDVEMVSGAKFYRPEGWVLVLPEEDEPLYRVYAEAVSPDTAKSLCHEYIAKIDQFARLPAGDPEAVEERK
jgi:mannose-1-phosphate guanylyltransferase/phosphomannomutase